MTPTGTLVLPPPSTLRTARLRLTVLRAADAPAVYAYASDPEVAQYVTWPPHRSVADAEAFIRMALSQSDTHVWAVREAAAGEDAPAIGAVSSGVGWR